MYKERLISPAESDSVPERLSYSSIEEIIDPDNRLPRDFTISETDQFPFFDGRGYAVVWKLISDDAAPFAHCALNIYDDNGDNNYVCFDGVEIDDQTFRGKGYGLAMYVAAIEYAHNLGLPFRTQDWDQTEYAVRIWQMLRDIGIAREVQAFYLSGVKNVQLRGTMEFVNQQRYKGVYYIDPLTISSN